MSLPGNGIFVVKGEMAILMTAMRRGNRWISHSHQDEDLDPLMKSFQDLKNTLNKIEDLRIVEPMVFLGPFLEVIKSDDTTGPVTNLALSAVNKFLSYGIIDATHSSVPSTVKSIADAVTHARFVGTDQSSDSVVLMKILQVLRTLTLSPEGASLTNENLCEIMLSCFKICFETRLSELLRKTAELYLKDMVQLVFMRLPQFPDAFPANIKQFRMRPGAIEQTRTKRKSRSSFRSKTKPILDKSGPQEKRSDDDIQTLTNNGSTQNLRINQHSPHPDNTSMISNTNIVDGSTQNLRINQHSPHPDNTSMISNTNIVDMQGSISQSQINENQISLGNEGEKNENSEQNDTSEASIKDPAVDNQDNGNGDVSIEEAAIEPVEIIDHETMDIEKIEADNLKQNEMNSLDSADLNIETTLNNQEYVNPRGIRFTPQSQEDLVLMPYGLASVRELFRFLISLCNPMDKQNTDVMYGLASVRELFRFLISLCNPMDKQNTDVMIHLGLSLLTVALEVGADSIGKYSSLLSLVRDDLCRNLFSLLNTERIAMFAADLQLSFLMFESLRTHLKFQLEYYLTKLIEIIVSDSVKVTYEHKEIALDNILQMWRIPGLVTELYLNYDCNLYCTNLYEDITKLLAKNAFPVTAGIYNTHLLSLDALLTVIESIESNCNKKLNLKAEIDNSIKPEIESINSILEKHPRQKISDKIPTRDELLETKSIKKWLPMGTEHFNIKPKKGIQFLQEHGVLKPDLDPHEIVQFLRENPSLDKRMIGEYISSRNNPQVLEAFVNMFDFTDMRIDEALRLYLETFRLPGEAPLISLLMEHFADRWHKCNGEPFADSDAAFTLAFAIIMLNVDQHNHNAKKQNTPMSAEAFKKNLKKVNGGNDFDQDVLEEIYNSIKNEEIVMPAEHTGAVKENYLWKVLLRRGASRDGIYTHVCDGTFDYDLFALIFGPVLSALTFVFDRSEDPNIYKRALQGFERCACISSNFGATANLDMLILTLCKFTLLHNQGKQSNLPILLGQNIKAQLCLKTVFSLIHQYGDNVREGWKNIFDLILTLYSINFLPKTFIEVEDFIEPSGKVTLVYKDVQALQKQESGLFSSLYSYMVSSENLSKIPTPEDEEYIASAKNCLKICNLEQLVADSKFLHEDSLVEMVKALIELSRGPDVQKSLGYMYNESVAVFFLELLLRIVIQNRDRVMTIWQTVREHLYILVMNASHCDYQFLLERSVIGLLRLAIRLMRNEEMSPIVLQSLRLLLLLKSSTLYRISRQISFGLYELLKTSAQNIHTSTDWSIIFTLLECVGAGAQPPKPITDESQLDPGARSEGEGPVSSEEESSITDRGYTSDSELTKSPKHTSRSQSPIVLPITTPPQHTTNTGGWILVGNEGEIQPVVGRTPPATSYSLALERNLGPHDKSGLVKCCESLAFLVRDVAHITPYNFDDCVHCIRTFVEASLHESKRTRKNSKRDSRPRRKPARRRETRPTRLEDVKPDQLIAVRGYHQVCIQLLDLMHTLHTRTAQIFRWWAEEGGELTQEVSLWTQGWCPLLQGIARLCCDTRKQVRINAISYLQRALLVHDLQMLTAPEWEACFQRVLFPLLSQLLEQNSKDPVTMEEFRIRAATVLSKVFLHHLTPLLSLNTFGKLWLTILDYMDKYMHAEGSDLLYEAIPESLKNMLLVMESAKVFEGPDGPNILWAQTWDRINKFLPQMKEELFREREVLREADSLNHHLPPEKQPLLEEQKKQQIKLTQHNIENATRSSIILQPPTSQHTINSPLFAHLGQMVSTPIGPPTSEVPNVQLSPSKMSVTSTNLPPSIQPVPIISSLPSYQPSIPLPQNILTNVPNTQGHTFPVLYSSPLQFVTASEVQPASLYSDYMQNPYNFNSIQSMGDVPVRSTQNIVLSENQLNVQNVNIILPSAGGVTQDLTSNSSVDLNKNLDADSKDEQQNIFQSSNYFCNDQNIVAPPGMEFLYGSEQRKLSIGQNVNIPISTTPTTN
ncbi:Guanine nucleotide exchange factor in Golgi transport N-terminal [Popillia japonica]|uniref:Guanine nucleotide exchange factor in Golgi transport N-terminal n=1 Tax=Popillia japonica TaxID=7064 RepID=A0AAW1KI60_POPJA